jgi:molybdopterin-guanine dinucleotide biosynthesis protein A
VNNSKKLVGVVLAGGNSRRMGNDKALLQVDAKNMIERTIDIIKETGVDQVVVSRNDGQDKHIQDLIPNKGPLCAIYSVMSAFPDCDLLIVPVDLPLLNKRVLELLVQAGQASKCSTHFSTHVLPLYIYNHIEMQAYLEDTLSNEGNLSIRRFVASFPNNEIGLAQDDALFNANTPEQWQQAMDVKGKL